MYSTSYSRYLNIRDCFVYTNIRKEITKSRHRKHAHNDQWSIPPKKLLDLPCDLNPSGNSCSGHIGDTVRTVPGLAVGHKKAVKVSTTLLLCEDQYTTLSSWVQGVPGCSRGHLGTSETFLPLGGAAWSSVTAHTAPPALLLHPALHQSYPPLGPPDGKGGSWVAAKVAADKSWISQLGRRQ